MWALKFKIGLLFCICLSGFAQAHPVIFKSGWVYWGQFSSSHNTQRISYTFHPRFSAEAYSSFYHSLLNYRDLKLSLNTLIKRWYFKNSQANAYFAVRAGLYQLKDLHLKKKRIQTLDGVHSQKLSRFSSAYSTDNAFKNWAVHPEMMLDWESRSLYTAFNFSYRIFNKNLFYQLQSRIGFAPYEGGMDELQVWLILQMDYFELIHSRLQITPMMRFFYKNALWEAGASLNGSFFLALMVHY